MSKTRTAKTEVMLAPVAIDNLYPDPDCKDLQEEEYCQYVYYKHFMELRRRYGKKLDDIVLSATAHPTETEHKPKRIIRRDFP